MRTVGLVLAVTVAASGAWAEEMMSAQELADFISGKSYDGVTPEEEDVVGTVLYNSDGTSKLTMADGTVQTGSWRIEEDFYCTRYDDFRDNTENCFRLEPLGDGKAQAYYTDGRPALILRPVE